MKYIIALLTFGLVSQAFAANRQVEHFYQADDGKIVNIFAMEYGEQNIKPQAGAGNETKISGFTNTVLFEKGFTNWLSVGGRFNYAVVATDIEAAQLNHNAGGLENPEIYANARMNLADSIELRGGLVYSVALENRFIDQDGIQTNTSLGRSSLFPFLGFNFNLGGVHTGIRLTQEVALSDIQSENTSAVVTKTSGAEMTSVDVYGEFLFDDWTTGLLVKYATFADTDTNGVSGQVPGFLRVNLYVPFYINEALTLRPEVFYDLYQDDVQGTTQLDSIDEYALNLSARFSF